MAADSITVPSDLIEYSSFASDIDLTAEHTTGPNAGQRARYIRVVSAGSGVLNVKLEGGEGNTRSLTVANDEQILGQFETIVASGTSVSKIRVGW